LELADVPRRGEQRGAAGVDEPTVDDAPLQQQPVTSPGTLGHDGSVLRAVGKQIERPWEPPSDPSQPARAPPRAPPIRRTSQPPATPRTPPPVQRAAAARAQPPGPVDDETLRLPASPS